MEDLNADRLDLLRELCVALTGDLDRRALLEAVANGTRRLLGAPLAAALSWDAARAEPVLEAVARDETVAPLLPGPELVAWVTPLFAQSAAATVHDLAGPLARALRVEAVAAVPLLGNGEAHGVALVAVRRRLGAEDLRLLEIYGAQAGLALANADTTAAALRRLAQTEALTSAFRDISWARDRETILLRSLDCATSILGADRAAVYLTNSREGVTFIASRRLSRSYLEAVVQRYRRSVGGLALVERTPIFVADVATDPRTRAVHEVAAQEGLHTTLIMPIVQRGQLYGALALYHDLVWPYELEDHARARALADEIAVALANLALHQSTQRQIANLRTLEAVASAAAAPGSFVERSVRVTRILVERGAAVRAWVLAADRSLVAAAGTGATDAEALKLAVDASAPMVGPIIADAGGATLLSAPLPDATLVLELAPALAADVRSPPFMRVHADEVDRSHDLELAAATAVHLAAGLEAAPRAAARA